MCPRSAREALTVVGGATHSTIFMQLMADVIGCTLKVPASPHTCVLRGAAIVAVAGMAAADAERASVRMRASTDVSVIGHGGNCGYDESTLAREMQKVSRRWLVMEKMYHPDPARHREYDFFFERYRATYARLRDEMHAMVAYQSRL